MFADRFISLPILSLRARCQLLGSVIRRGYMMKRRLKRLWRRVFPTTRNINKWLDELEDELHRMETALKEWAKDSPKVAGAVKKSGLL